MSEALSIQQFQGKDGYAEICGDWYELMQSVSNPCFYHHPAWFGAYFERSDSESEIFFRCVFDGSRLIAVCPLIFENRYGSVLREAALPNHDSLYMPDIAVAESADLSAVWAILSATGPQGAAEQWDLFHARSVLENSAVARALRASTGHIVSESEVGRCAIVDIVDYEDAIRSLRKKFRGNLNNARNRLAAKKEVEFHRTTRMDEMDAAFEEFVALEKSGWKGNPDRKRENYPQPAAIALSASKFLFYQSAVKEFAKTGSIEINSLKVNGKTIGSQIYVILRDCSFLLKTAFDEDFKGYSPGHVLLDYAYRRYAEAGTVNRICLITDYQWFKYWNPRYLNYLNVKAFRKNVRGRAASLAYTVLRKNQ